MEFAFFFGRFHPLIVHLPIGFLLLAILMWGFARWRGVNQYDAAISFGLLAGAISAGIACVLGYLLSLEGGFDEQLLTQHTWAGILTTMLATGSYMMFRYRNQMPQPKYLLSTLFILSTLGISVAGHLGGSLTHGQEYLVAYSPFKADREQENQLPQQLSEVVLYTHVVAPILEAKCISCHGKHKRKGGLSLADEAAILKGGENGAVLVPGNAAESELIKRITLLPAHEDVMPPAGKTPLTDQEKQCLSWWIDHGAAFDQKFTQIPEADQLTEWVSHRLALQGSGMTGMIALTSLPPIPDQVLDSLRDKGFVIRELVDGSNRFDVTFPTFGLTETYPLTELLADLSILHDHTMWLTLAGLGLKDEHVTSLQNLPNLEKLRLDQNQLTSTGIAHLRALPKLKVLNIYGNPVGAEALSLLTEFPRLERVYAWQTQIEGANNLDFELVQ